MSEIKSLIDDDIKEKIDNSAICVKFAMMSKQIEEKEQENERLKIIEEKYYLEMLDKINGYKKEIERLNNIINEFNKLIENEINESKLEEDYDRVDAMKYCLATLQELKVDDK